LISLLALVLKNSLPLQSHGLWNERSAECGHASEELS